MRKVLLIGWKDLTIAFRDRAALLLMLAAPFLLTLGLGFVTGRFSGDNGSGLSNIPVILVNQDQAQLGDALVSVFQSPDLSGLVEPTESDDPSAARRQVDSDQAAAAILIPAGFTRSIIPDPSDPNPTSAPVVQIEIYANPTRPTSAGVIQTIVEEFLSQVESGRVSAQAAVTELLKNGLIQPQQAVAVGQAIGQQEANSRNSALIPVETTSSGNSAVKFDVLAFMAPGMALFFLMYAVSYGGRSILAEQTQGTLPRLLVSPTSTSAVLGGKVLGIYLTGVTQLAVLILASTLLFNLQWGDALGVIVLVLAAVFAATGWGLVVTAFSRTPGQVGGVGSALMLIFGILGGSFVSLGNLPTWVQWLSKITPNAWGLDGFNTLARGGALGDILTPVASLLVMGAVLFALSVLTFNRSSILQR